MSTVRVNVANNEFDAAQALLDLQSNIRETKQEKYTEVPLSDGKESAETAKLFLSCFISSKAPSPPNNIETTSSNVGTSSPVLESTNAASKSEVTASSSTSKRKSPEPEAPSDLSSNSSPIEETCNKPPKIFKKKMIEDFTVTSGPTADTVANNIKDSDTGVDVHNVSKVVVTKREIGTQTDPIVERSTVESMEFTIAKLCEKIKVLQAQIESNSKLMKSLERDISDNNKDNENDDDDDVSNKVDESNAVDSDLDESMTESDTPTKVIPKNKRGQSSQHKKIMNSSKVPNKKNLNPNTSDMVSLGEGNASVPTRIYKHINWNSYTSATRKLLTAVFSRRVLATHSLTGKPSPAFPNKPAKKKLDSSLVNDIVQTVVERCGVPENVVRTSITTKCADESKMFRTRQKNKKKHKQKVNWENLPPDSDSDSD